MSAFVAAGAGFLLAVLWFDLMFDVQALRRGSAAQSDEAVDSIATYYARVTTAARPMNMLIGLVMLATLAAIVAQIARVHDPTWVGWASLALAAAPILLAALHTVPAAVRLGTGAGSAGERLELARSIARDHVACLVAIASLLTVQLGFGES